MKIVSPYDGMACAMIAMLEEGIEPERYIACEIDKYAVKTSSHNFPKIEHRGDVFKVDFTEFEGFDFLMGGSPCTYWSIAQKNGRETVASGMGWELFSQYVRALHEVKPRFFIYENNKSMSNAIRASITETFGFEPICINSALVSAQNRQRLYWVGKRNPDGTYSKVDVEQPEDRGILLKDVLDSAVAWQEKAFAYTTRCQGATLHDTLAKHRHTMVAEPVNCCGYKSHTLKAQYYKNGLANFVTNGGFGASGVAEPVNITADGKAQCLRATCYKDGIRNMVGNDVDRKTCVAEPVGIGYRGRWEDGAWVKRYESNEEPKANAITTAQTDSMVAQPVRVGIGNNAVPCKVGQIGNGGQGNRIYSVGGKSVTQTAQSGGIGSKTRLYAIPVEFEGDQPVKAVSGADGKEYPVYEVKDGFITIKDKRYAIKLADGYYIIRKLTVSECKRLQTVPEWFEFPVSDAQAYKMLGNGWTVSVIRHLIRACLESETDGPDESIGEK